MSHSQLIALAAWHEEQGRIAERDAAHYEAQIATFGTHLVGTVAALRNRAQWHVSTAIHLRELAEAFKQLFQAYNPS